MIKLSVSEARIVSGGQVNENLSSSERIAAALEQLVQWEANDRMKQKQKEARALRARIGSGFSSNSR